MNHNMTKPTKWVCASKDSDQPGHPPSLTRVFAVRSMGSQGPNDMGTAETLIRLGECPGWSESLLGAQSFCWFCHVVAQILSQNSALKCHLNTWNEIFPQNCFVWICHLVYISSRDCRYTLKFEPRHEKTCLRGLRPGQDSNQSAPQLTLARDLISLV